jgi:HPt (histidine-containing phosphotransfer) domain-containing protein
LARLAHMVKGAAANVSATSVSDAAAQLERLGTAADFEAVKTSLDQLAAQVEQCRACIPQVVEYVRRSDSQFRSVQQASQQGSPDECVNRR